MRDIPIGLLRAFVAVAETGSMTRAAKVVNVTQSAVSQKIARLEALLSRQLFERRSDFITLTADGERFLRRAHQMVALNDQVFGEISTPSFSGEIRFGVPHDVVGSLLPPVLRSFSQQRPNVLVTLVSDTTAVLSEMLSQRALDLALTTDPEPANGDDHLFADPLVWAGAPSGDAAGRTPLSVALGREQCGFRKCAIEALDRTGRIWRPICQVGSLEPVFATLEADMAIAPFLSRTVPRRLAILDDPALPSLPVFHLNLRWKPGVQTPIAQELARYVRDGLLTRYSRLR